MLRLVLLLALLLSPPAMAEEVPSHGLIRNYTGLPMTLPLQVKTNPGRDVYIVMRNAETTEIAVTAYIEGGRFFRLMMPPGTYTMHAAIGAGWEGEEDLFGAATEFYTLPEALTFQAGTTRRTGASVDLRTRDQLVQDFALCSFSPLAALWYALPDDWREDLDPENRPRIIDLPCAA